LRPHATIGLALVCSAIAAYVLIQSIRFHAE
jgi:hypothetical protein